MCPHSCGQCSLHSEARCNKDRDIKVGRWEGEVLGEVGRGEEEMMVSMIKYFIYVYEILSDMH